MGWWSRAFFAFFSPLANPRRIETRRRLPLPPFGNVLAMVSAKNLTYDDRDTTHLRYAGFWFNTGSYNASSVGQTGTLSSTEDINANVTFTFPEPANAFYYFGIPRCCGGLYAICIDCDPNAPNFISIDAVNRTDDGKNPPVALFTHVFDDFGYMKSS